MHNIIKHNVTRRCRDESRGRGNDRREGAIGGSAITRSSRTIHQAEHYMLACVYHGTSDDQTAHQHGMTGIAEQSDFAIRVYPGVERLSVHKPPLQRRLDK